jgi:hypothetical protein
MSVRRVAGKIFVLAFFILVLGGAVFLLLPQWLGPRTGVVRLADGTAIAVAVASDPVARAKGLSGQPYLPANQGMLFVFAAKNLPVFWMKDMNFPIDMVWIADGRVVGVTEQVAVPKAGELARYHPPEPVDMVLEVPSGFCRARGLSPSDRLEISF